MNVAGKFGLIGVVALICIVVAMSGCTSTASNKTYTQGTVSFTAPDNLQPYTTSSDIISGSNAWTTLAQITNNETNIIITKASGSDVTPQTSQLATDYSIKQNNGNITSTTKNTNPNGVLIYGSTQNLADPSSNELLTYYDMTFAGSDGNVYSIDVFGTSGNREVLNTKNMVYDSLKA